MSLSCLQCPVAPTQGAQPYLCSLPGFYIVPALPQKAFGKNLTQKSAAQLVQSGDSPGAQPVELELPFPRAFGHSDTDWGHQQGCIVISGIHLLLEEFSCSNEGGVASEAIQLLQDSVFPLGITTGHDASSSGKKPACTFSGYYVFIALMMSLRNIRAGCYCKFCLLKGSILSWLPSTTN